MTISSINRFRGRLRIYSRTMLWLVREVAFNFKGPAIRVVFSGLTGIFGQGLGLLIIFSFARALETGQRASLRGVVLPLAPTYENLLIISAGVFALLLISAICQFDAQRQALAIACRFEEHLVRRTIVDASRVPPSARSSEHVHDSAYLTKLATRDAKITSRVVFLLISNLIDFCFLLAFLSFVFWLDWMATSLVIVLMSFYGAALYWLNIYGVHSARTLERNIGHSTMEKRRIVARFLRSTVPIALDDPDIEHIFSRGRTAKALDSYERRLAIIPIGNLIGSSFTAFVICAVLALFGAVIFFEAGSWSRLLAYVLALRLVLRRVTKVMSGATSISRLYPSARRIYDFVKDIEDTEVPREKRQHGNLHLSATALHTGGHRSDGLEVKRGQPALILNSVTLSRGHVSAIITRMPGAAGAETAIVAVPESLRPIPLKNFLPPSFQDDWPTLRQQLCRLGFAEDDLKGLAAGLETPIGGERKAVAASIPFAALALASLRSGATIIFLDAEPFFQLSESIRHSFLEVLQDRIVFFHLISKDNALDFPFTGNAVVMANNRIVGWAPFSWVRDHAEILPRPKSELPSHGAGVVDDLDELMYE